MNLTDYQLTNRQSIVDKSNKLNQSTIDYHTEKLKLQLNDPTLGERMVALALKKLGEGQVMAIADYACRKAHTPGKAFVAICCKAIKEKV